MGVLSGSIVQCNSKTQHLESAGCCTGPRGKVMASIAPKAGRALLHRHGDCCLEHEAAPVASGLKYILRTDVCFAAA